MEQKINKLWSEVYGNGNDGLKTDMALMKDKMTHIEAQQEKIATALSGINKYVTENDAEKEIREKTQEIKRAQMNNRIIQFLMIAGLAVSIFVSLMK